MKSLPVAAALLVLASLAPAHSQDQRGGPRAVTRSAPAPQPQPAPPPPPPPPPLENLPPYEPQLMRLSEIMGALSYLRDLCGSKDGAEWQSRMNALIEAEASTETRRERLAGAFNRGFRGYQVTYRSCTPNAELVMDRYLDEGARITREISGRYGGG